MSEEQQRVLIVDDTKTNIDVLVHGLKDEYKLSIALNGANALKSVESNPPDLILLDIMMPEMDGYEVCQKLKSNPQTAEIPVIFVTAMSEVEDETKGLELGAVDYITKPISMPIVKARVKSHLRLRSALVTLEEQNQQLIEAARLKEDVDRISRHDLKQPLTGIISFPKLIKMTGGVSEQQEQMLTRIEESGYRLLDMINLSLGLFKMEQGNYQLEPEPVNLVDVIERVKKESQQVFESHGIDLLLTLNNQSLSESDKFMIQGEELLCYSLFANLIKNAMEACPEQQDIIVNFSEENPSKVSIRNAGEVPVEIRETFFDKYATSGKSSGTGLGTYSAKLITKTQGGDIDLDSSEPGFTTINVYLPVN